MAKQKPTYDLAQCQATVAALRHKAFTQTALNGIVLLGLSFDDALKTIASLTEADFHKTMAANQDPGMFQDVYRGLTPDGKKTAYIKFTAYSSGRVVIQFKEK